MSIRDTTYFINVLLCSAADQHLDSELLRAVAAVDMHDLLIEAPIVGRDHLTKSITSAMVVEARPADLALLSRLETFAAMNEANRALVVQACPGHLVVECFVKVESIRSMDFARFDAQMARLMACLGRSYLGDEAIGGMEPAQYWSMMVSSCKYFDGDDGVEVFVSDTQPDHWAAWLHHAIDCGMTQESPVAPQGERPAFATGSTETFRQAIEVRAGVGCAAMFDAIVTERAMEARLRSSQCAGSGVLNSSPNARRRGPL